MKARCRVLLYDHKWVCHMAHDPPFVPNRAIGRVNLQVISVSVTKRGEWDSNPPETIKQRIYGRTDSKFSEWKYMKNPHSDLLVICRD